MTYENSEESQRRFREESGLWIGRFVFHLHLLQSEGAEFWIYLDESAEQGESHRESMDMGDEDKSEFSCVNMLRHSYSEQSKDADTKLLREMQSKSRFPIGT